MPLGGSSWISAHRSWYMEDDTAAGGTKREFDTWTCNHCQGQVLTSPERVRPRELCFICFRVVCDRCKRLAQIFGCQPFSEIAEAVLSGKLEQNRFGLLLPHTR